MTSVVRRREHDDSGEYSDASQDIDHNNSGNDGGPPESDYDSQASDSDRSDRDPESQETERRVDDDEDRSNPQYIPKRGTFYEHDDRTAASGEESSNTTSETASEKKEGSETPAERRRAPRKSDIINKWSHDKYNENEQMPKSRDELVAIYGYDIRNEDAPPHARRNRRYGRGPNKYTRTWEDEEAYKRQSATQPQPRKPPNPDEFPDLEASKKYSKKPGRTPRPRSKSQPASNESLENGSQLRRNASIKTTKGKNERQVKTNTAKGPVKSPPKPRIEPTKDKMPPIENLTITAPANTNQGQTPRRVSQQRPVPTDLNRRKPTPQTAQPQGASGAPPSKSPPQQPQQPQQKPQPHQNQQQPPPATGTEARGGSKRYSSLRQRPLAESYAPQQQQQQQQQSQQQQQQPTQQQPQQQSQQQQMRYSEFGAGGPPASQHQGSPVPQMHPPQLMHQVHRPPAPHGPSPPHQPLPQQHSQQQQVRLGLLEQQQLVPHPHPHSLHNMPQPHAMPHGQLQATQGYAPPAMMPAQYMQPAAAGGGSGGVFPAGMYPQPPQPYPIYPHHNYATQAGGVTYYSCAEQEPPPPPRATRRPTAAIPIVRPAAPTAASAPSAPAGAALQALERPANPSDKDNIDRIVENMFVRRPWPATPGGDSKEKKEERSSQEPQSKESSQPNSLTSSSISTDSKPSENKEEKLEEKETDDVREERSVQESETQENIQENA